MGNICPVSGPRQPKTGHSNPVFKQDETPTAQDPGVRGGNDRATPGNQPRAVDNDYIVEKAMTAGHDNQGSASMNDQVPTTQETASDIEVVALYGHMATDEEDLSFNKGDVFWLISTDSSSDSWCRVRTKSGEIGFVPLKYVAKKGDLMTKQWYHGDITGLQATTIVQDSDRESGDFLVRKSQNREDQHSLTMLWCDEAGVRSPIQYKILPDDDGQVYILTSQKFPGLTELINHYIRTKGGLRCCLRSACPKQKPSLPDLSSKWTNTFEITKSSITLKELLGEGNFGKVIKGLWENTLEVAVKTPVTGKVTKETFLEEAVIMKTLQHPNIVRLYGVCSEDPVFIVTELMENGSLLDFLRDDKGPGPTLPQGTLIGIAAQVARGMAYIEKKDLIHRDLAARNVLVGQGLVVKIADFGLARSIKESIYTKLGGEFPVKWAAPEILSHGTYSIKSDVWAFGILLVEIITRGGKPYPGRSNRQVIEHILHKNCHPQPDKCPNDLYGIMRSCWDHERAKRPSFAELEDDLLHVESSPVGPRICRSDDTENEDEPPYVLPDAEPGTSHLKSHVSERAPETPSRSAKDPPQGKKILVALFDFQSGASCDLSFTKGDRFEGLEGLEGGTWPLVVHLTTEQKGHVPANYVAEENTDASYPWFQPDVSKSEAELILMAEGNEVGVFLIRASSAPNKQYPLVLAVLCHGKTKAHVVKNHRIEVDESGKYFIDQACKWETLQRLVTHYQGNPALGCVLTEPCQRVSPVVPDLSSQTQDSLKVRRELLKKLDKLGNGNFGEVWKGVWNGHVPVAIKCANPNVISPDGIMKEATVMKKLKHKHLVRFYGVCSEEPIFIVTELVRFGDLRSYLKSETGGSLAFQERLAMAQQVVQAMTYLESKKFVHGDLAARNILLGDNHAVKVADFGLARALIDKQYIAHGSSFPLKWTALEVINGNEFSSTSDVWSFGIVLVEIVTDGEEPYPEQKDWTHANLVEMLNKGERHPQPPNCSGDLYKIMKRCWKKDAMKRPSFKEIQTLLLDFISHYEN